MSNTFAWRMTAVAAVFLAVLVISWRRLSISDAAENAAILTGTLTSNSGNKMEGVTVSAQKDGESIVTTVFTDEQGNYYFPAGMANGTYHVWAQAEGYETGKSDTVVGASIGHQDFQLKSAKDFSKQLTGAEYVEALPADTPQHKKMKDVFYGNCTGCHEASYVLQNRFDAAGWESVINLMGKVRNGDGEFGGQDQSPWPVMTYYKKDLAAYLGEVRGEKSTLNIHPRPRPTGDAARAVITEYRIPIADSDVYNQNDGYATNDGSDWSLGTPSSLNGVRGAHDSQMDLNGNIWFTYAIASYVRSLGMVDAETGKVTNVKVPGPGGLAAFTHGLAMDQKGNLWFTVAGATEAPNGIGSFGSINPSTMKVSIYPPSKGMAGVGGGIDVDLNGNVWASTNRGALRFDPKTQQFTEFKSLTPMALGSGSSYGIAADHDGNGWWTQINIDLLGKSYINTGESSEIKLPPIPNRMGEQLTDEDRQMYQLAGVEATDMTFPWAQGPRRLGADKNGDSVYVCNYWGGDMAKYDIHTLKPTFYPYPTPQSAPYDAVVDKSHMVWVSLTQADAVARFDPKTAQWTEFPLPTHGVELRHLSISEITGSTQVVLAYWRSGKVARIQLRTKEDLQVLKQQSLEQVARAK